MKRAALLGLVLFSCRPAPATAPAPTVRASAPAPSQAEPGVHGHLLSATGAPLPLAHVTILGPDGKLGERREVARDGSFRLPLPPFTQRLTRVRVSGAAHRPETLVIAAEDRAVDVSIKLGEAAPRGDAKPAVVLFTSGDPKPKPMMKPQPMTKGADGAFSVEVEAPDGRYSYMIAGVLNDPPRGQPADGYELTEHGTYRPQIVVHGGKARITYDPKLLHESAAIFEFADPASASAGLTAVAARVMRTAQNEELLFDEIFHAKGGPAPDASNRLTAAIRADVEAARRDLAASAKTASSPIVRQAAAVAYFQGPPIASPSEEERALASQALAEIAPDDALWSLFPSLVNVMKVAGTTPKTDEYANAFIAKQAGTTAVAKLLIARIVDTKDASQRRALVAELRKPRFDGSIEQKEASMYDPDRRLAPGKDIALDVKSLTGAKVTPKELAGKVFLVEVWGTWCVPCVAEMPHLHELYAKYGGAPTAGRKKRFEILSIALESDAGPVKKFRENKAHPMPWLNALGDPDTFFDTFAGMPMGVPSYVLVDDKGKILASSPELSVKELPELLDRALR